MTYYKDYSKDIKDLLTKNYIDGGKWKYESKVKAAKDVVTVNPQGSNSGLTADIEYVPSSCGAKVKLNVNPELAVKLTASYEEKGHKVEVVTDKSLNYEVSYDGKVAGVAISDKLTKTQLEAGVSVPVAKNCQIGAGATYGLKDGSLKWTAGARYAEAGRLVTLQTVQLQKYLTGLLLPVTVAGQKLTVAAQFECAKGSFAATAGLEVACPLVPKNALRVRLTDKLAYAAAYIIKLPDNLKAAISIDSSLKPGLTLTHE